MYDFKNSSNFTPYIGAGLTDIGWNSYGEDAGNYDELYIEGMFIAGLSYNVSEKWAINLEYNRNFGAEFLFNSDDTETDSAGWSTWKLGAAYKF